MPDGADGITSTPASLTVTVCPAIVNVPTLGGAPVFDAITYVTIPLFVPLLPPVTVIHDTLLTAVHAQPAVVDTVVVLVAPASATV
jgi:hypothetical protein